MPYIKTLAGNKKESYEIQHISIDIDGKTIHINLHHIKYDENHVPKIKIQDIAIQNLNEEIVDTEWNAQSTPAKPANFILSDASTWGAITRSQIPLVIDTSKQYFDKLIAKSGTSGSNIYTKVKHVIYEILQDMEKIPDGSAWRVI